MRFLECGSERDDVLIAGQPLADDMANLVRSSLALVRQSGNRLKDLPSRGIQPLGKFFCLAHALAHGGFRRSYVYRCQDVDNFGRFYVIETVKHCQRCYCRLHAIGACSVDSELAEAILQSLAVYLTGTT